MVVSDSFAFRNNGIQLLFGEIIRSASPLHFEVLPPMVHQALECSGFMGPDDLDCKLNPQLCKAFAHG